MHEQPLQMTVGLSFDSFFLIWPSLLFVLLYFVFLFIFFFLL